MKIKKNKVSKKGLTMKNDIRDFLLINEKSGKSTNTLVSYKTDLNQFHKYLCSIYKYRWNTVTKIDIINFLGTFGYEKKYNKTKNRKKVSITMLFNYLVKIKKIETNIVLDIANLDVVKKNAVFLSADEAIQMLENANNNLRDKAILTIFLYLGLRVSEISNLNYSSISNRKLYIMGKGDKERVLPLPQNVLDSINDYTDSLSVVVHDELPLFLNKNNGRLSVRSIQKLVKKYLDNIDLGDREITPHKLRHTCATLLAKQQVSPFQIKEILGHSSIETTNIYVHLGTSDIASPLNNMQNVLGGDKN